MSNSQINAAAAPSATAARAISVNKVVYWGINFGISILFVGVGVILANTGLDFAWKLIIAFALIYIGNKLGKMKLPAALSPFIWPGIIRSTGWLVLIIVLLFSGFGEISRVLANMTEQKVARMATTLGNDCPEVGKVEDLIRLKEGMVITVSADPNCATYVDQREFATTGFMLMPVDKRLDMKGNCVVTCVSGNFPGVDKYEQSVLHRNGKETGVRRHVVRIYAVGAYFDELGLPKAEFVVKRPAPNEVLKRP